jgi:F0F1-type ATP synthase assembly protein I
MGRLVQRYRVKAFARSYQAGLEAIFALALAVGIGFWVDSRYDTLPVFLLAGTAVGFGACVLRLLRHQRELDKRGGEIGGGPGGGGTGDDATD